MPTHHPRNLILIAITFLFCLNSAMCEPTQPTEPPNDEKQKANQIIIQEAGVITTEDDLITIDQGVKLLWGEYTFIAQKVVGDTKKQIFTFLGGIQLEGKGQLTQGDELLIDFKKKKWEIKKGKTIITPSFTKNELLDNIFAQGELIEGAPDKVFIFKPSFTSCSKPEPHYHLNAQSITIDPGNKIVMRQVGIEILGKNLFTLPYVVIPLAPANSSEPGIRFRYNDILPDIGRSADEGFYLKSAYGFTLGNKSAGNLKLDLMEKKGIGFGFDTQLKSIQTQANIGAYFLANQTTNSNEWNAYGQAAQKIGSTDIKLRSDYKKSSYNYYPENTLFSNSLDIRFSPKSMAQLSVRQSENTSAGFTYSTLTSNFSDFVRLSERMRYNIDIGYQKTDSDSPYGGVSRQSIDTRGTLEYATKEFDTQLLWQQYAPIGDSTGFYAGLEKLPELKFQSDARRLFGETKFAKNFPFTSSLSFGSFSEQGGVISTERMAVELASSKYSSSKKGFNLGYNANFKQSFYGDDTAQYILNGALDLKYMWTDKTSFTVRYNYNRPYGYSPFYFDRSGTTNLMNAGLELQLTPAVKLQAQSGYDFYAEKNSFAPYQPAWLNVLYTPGKWLKIRSSMVYDPNSERLTSIRSDASALIGKTKFFVTARYDAQRDKWNSINFRADGIKWGNFNLNTILMWDGYLNQFTAQHYTLTYDMHCAEAILRYVDNPFGYRKDREMSLYIRIKAFPFFNRYGIGQQGESLSTGTGDDF